MRVVRTVHVPVRVLRVPGVVLHRGGSGVGLAEGRQWRVGRLPERTCPLDGHLSTRARGGSGGSGMSLWCHFMYAAFFVGGILGVP